MKNQQQARIRQLLSEKLQKQMEENVGESEKQKQTPRKAKQHAPALLNGSACPHGKMYVCAFCGRDQAKQKIQRKPSKNH